MTHIFGSHYYSTKAILMNGFVLHGHPNPGYQNAIEVCIYSTVVQKFLTDSSNDCSYPLFHLG